MTTNLMDSTMPPTSILAASSRQRESSDSLNTVAYRRIREKIVRLELPPASVIDESSLVYELGIGLTPIRQALRRLALENMVVIFPRRGTLVADLNMSDLQKIFEIRIELEALVVRLAAERATDQEIARMESHLAIETLSKDLGDPQGGRNELLIQKDREAHLLLAAAARNEFLAETLDSLYCHVLRLWYVLLNQVKSLDTALEEHRQIVSAIKDRNARRAEAIMRQHVAAFQDEVRAKI
jgi:DNA-binding GntR family transcriptional regulator